MAVELMLGAAAPAAESFMQVVLSIALIASVSVNIAQLFRGGRAQKREVSFADQFASKELFDKHERENKREHEFLHKRISDGDHELQAELKKDFNCVREELSECRSELAAAAQANLMQNQALIRIEAKIDSKK